MSALRRLGAHLTARHLGALMTLVICLGWAILFRPVALGGPASYIIVSGTSMQPTLFSGDLVVLKTADVYENGDVITYRVPDGKPGAGTLVIHRITGGDATHGFRTQGDNRAEADDWSPTSGDVAGKLWLTVPGAGRALAQLRDPTMAAAAAGGLVVTMMLLQRPRRRVGAEPALQSTELEAGHV
jgi:signal peptidase